MTGRNAVDNCKDYGHNSGHNRAVAQLEKMGIYPVSSHPFGQTPPTPPRTLMSMMNFGRANDHFII